MKRYIRSTKSVEDEIRVIGKALNKIDVFYDPEGVGGKFQVGNLEDYLKYDDKFFRCEKAIPSRETLGVGQDEYVDDATFLNIIEGELKDALADVTELEDILNIDLLQLEWHVWTGRVIAMEIPGFPNGYVGLYLQDNGKNYGYISNDLAVDLLLGGLITIDNPMIIDAAEVKKLFNKQKRINEYKDNDIIRNTPEDILSALDNFSYYILHDHLDQKAKNYAEVWKYLGNRTYGRRVTDYYGKDGVYEAIANLLDFAEDSGWSIKDLVKYAGLVRKYYSDLNTKIRQ